MTDLESERKQLLAIHAAMVEILKEPITQPSRTAYSNLQTLLGIRWSALRSAMDKLSFGMKA